MKLTCMRPAVWVGVGAAVAILACGKPGGGGAEEDAKAGAAEKKARPLIMEFLAAVEAGRQDLIKGLLADAQLFNAGKPWQIPEPYVALWTQDDPTQLKPPERAEPEISALPERELTFHKQVTHWAPPDAVLGMHLAPNASGTLMDKAELLFFLAPEQANLRIAGFIDETRERNLATGKAIAFLKAAAEKRYREAQAMIAGALPYSEGKPWQNPTPFVPDLVEKLSRELGGPLSTETLAFRFLSPDDFFYMREKVRWSPPEAILGATLSPLVFGEAESDLVLHFYFAPEGNSYRIAGFVCAEDRAGGADK